MAIIQKTKQKIIEWAKVQLGMHDLEHRISTRVESAESYIRDRTVAHLDVHAHPNTPTQVVVIGRYQGGDYVRTLIPFLALFAFLLPRWLPVPWASAV